MRWRPKPVDVRVHFDDDDYEDDDLFDMVEALPGYQADGTEEDQAGD